MQLVTIFEKLPTLKSFIFNRYNHVLIAAAQISRRIISASRSSVFTVCRSVMHSA